MGLQNSTGYTLWLTGLPCSGKSTLAAAVQKILLQAGQLVEVLDGDIIRQNLCEDLGFSRSDRDRNIRRITFVSHLLARNGVTVIVAMVSPYREARDNARAKLGRFVEVHVTCPLAECERRDVKGMYKMARAGQLSKFTGIDDPYEAPLSPEVRIDTSTHSVAESAAYIVERLRVLGYLTALDAGSESSTLPTARGYAELEQRHPRSAGKR